MAVCVSRFRAEKCQRMRKSSFCNVIRLCFLGMSTGALTMQRKYDFFPSMNVLLQRIGLIEKWHRNSDIYQNDVKRESDHRVILTVAHIVCYISRIGVWTKHRINCVRC